MVSVAKMMTNNYWRNREREERKWQLQQLKQDGQFNKELERYYNQAINNINKEIDAEFSRLAYRNKTSIAEAKSAVSQADMQAYADEAAKLVEEARLRRAAGHKVTYADYSDEVNERMRIYNATMRINRLELLKSRIGLQMIDAGIKVDESMQAKVADDYMAELKRQAGILGLVTEGDQLWSSKDVAKQITAQVNGATFSQRIWANQDALKARLDEVISTGILRGDNPREMARQLKQQVRDTVTNHRYVTERIARTESARAQFNAQKALIKQNGYRYVKWYAEPGACKICREIADSDRYDLGFGVYPVDEVPSIPAHPNCRCSISAYWVDKRQNAESGGDYRVGNNHVNLDYIKSPDYRRKFDNITSNPYVNQQLYKYAKAMLIHRQGTDGEDSYILNKDGKLVNRSFGRPGRLEVEVPRSRIVELNNKYGQGTLIGMHNHPTNVPPTGSDFAAAGFRQYDFGIVVSHDGSIYVYSTGNVPFSGQAVDKFIEKYRLPPYNLSADEAVSKTILELRRFGLKCEKL